MRKVWTIACRESAAMVATKAFLLTITMMPILMFGGIIVANQLKDVQDTDDKIVVIVDGSGTLFDDLKLAADARNAQFTDAKISSRKSGDADGTEPQAVGPKYVLRLHPNAELSEEEHLAFSNQIRNDEIEAFAEIPAEVMSDDPVARATAKVRFHAQNAILSAERRWLDRTINDTVRARRLAALNIDPQEVRSASTPVPVVPLGLFKKASDGEIQGTGKNRNLAGIFMPFGMM